MEPVQTTLPDEDSVLIQLTKDILTLIKAKNYSALVQHIHPVTGIRFSPYGYVDTVRDIVLSREGFSGLVQATKKEKLYWGEKDGSGDSILMTLPEYIQEYVYDVDFLNPEKRTVDKFLGGGNSLNNLRAIYKDSRFTESYFSGFEEKYEGMDWRSLRLVFTIFQGKYYLTGVVHDEWTS